MVFKAMSVLHTQTLGRSTDIFFECHGNVLKKQRLNAPSR